MSVLIKLAPQIPAGLLLTVVSLFFSWWRRGAFLLWIACSLGIWRCALRVPDLCLDFADLPDLREVQSGARA